MIEVRALTGDALDNALDDVARLRIEVFRDWPYLYDGSPDYERDYLQTYRDSPKAILVGAFADGVLVGAATATPMTDHADEFGAAFKPLDIALERIFYCAESVLLPDWRGQGIGHAFFDARENHARTLGYDYMAFCSVVRPTHHPLRPASFRTHDAFWRKRGYAPLPNITASFSWKDIGQPNQTAKTLQFWMRHL